MLALRQVTQSVLPQDALALLSSSRLASWPALCAVAALFLLGPSWLTRGTRMRQHWPECGEGHFKNA
jgi:hypothetical protein